MPAIRPILPMSGARRCSDRHTSPMRKERAVRRTVLGGLWRSAVVAFAVVGAGYLFGLIDDRSDAWFFALFGIAYGVGAMARLVWIDQRSRRKSAAAGAEASD